METVQNKSTRNKKEAGSNVQNTAQASTTDGTLQGVEPSTDLDTSTNDGIAITHY